MRATLTDATVTLTSSQPVNECEFPATIVARGAFEERKNCQVERRDAGGRLAIESNRLIERGRECVGALSKQRHKGSWLFLRLVLQQPWPRKKFHLVGIFGWLLYRQSSQMTPTKMSKFFYPRPKPWTKKGTLATRTLPGSIKAPFPSYTFHLPLLFVTNILRPEAQNSPSAHHFYAFASSSLYLSSWPHSPRYVHSIHVVALPF